MKRKILFLTCLILCCIISFQMIAAGDGDNQNLTDSENSEMLAVEVDDEDAHADDEDENVMQSTQDSQVLKKEVPWSTDNVVYGSTTDGTFSDLRNLIENANPNAVVVLQCNYKFNETVDLADKIHIMGKSLIIDGLGHP